MWRSARAAICGVAMWPLDPGYPTRKLLYRLYHTLNHYNIFGGGYGSAAEGIVSRLLRAL